METSSRSGNIISRFSAAVLLGIALLWSLSAAPTMAQEKRDLGAPVQSGAATPTIANRASTPVQSNSVALPVNQVSTPDQQKPASSATNTGSVPASKKTGDTANSASDYKGSLTALSTLYENEVQRLEQRNNQSKDLYNQGLISRVDMEASDKALADARAKVADIHNQITAANKPVAPVISGLSANSNSDLAWSTGNSKIDSLIRFYANKYSVDSYLIYCLMSQESRFTMSATSPKGAQGLMQLMPGTAARYGVTNPYDVAQSIMGGTRYLKDLLQMFNGRVDLALAGYNAGENAVIKYGYKVPPYEETRSYVRLIVARYAKKQTS
ncbi:MAG TPA: lytic transglycosylase domain-containing protein [Pyrinomonadaceae bacterium]|nr:lytic transglycosylase domain-containing protein [Pyrinomonadaceae bacterium]